jgi:hypothetical protein
MATGIVSIALSLARQTTLAHVLLALTVLAWVALGVLAAARLARHPQSLVRGASFPAALTAVAGSAVLATGLTSIGWTWAGSILLAGSFV